MSRYLAPDSDSDSDELPSLDSLLKQPWRTGPSTGILSKLQSTSPSPAVSSSSSNISTPSRQTPRRTAGTRKTDAQSGDCEGNADAATAGTARKNKRTVITLNKARDGKQPAFPSTSSPIKQRTSSGTSARGQPPSSRECTPPTPTLVPDSDRSSSRYTSFVPDSEEDQDQLSFTSHLAPTHTTTLASRSLSDRARSSRVFGGTPAIPASTPRPTHSRSPSAELADLLFPADEFQLLSRSDASTSKETPKPATSRKKRRITIITIPSDSEDEPSPPTRLAQPAVASTNVSDAQEHKQHDEVSFADYSDDEELRGGGRVLSPSKKPSRSSIKGRAVDVDSSDSEYDAESGVLVWHPSPTKPKSISPVKPMLATPVVAGRKILSPSTATRTNLPSSFPCTGHGHTETPAPTPKASKKTQPIASTSKSTLKSPTKRRPDTKQARSFAKERDELATSLVEELDAAVFKGRLPDDLKIVWNGRLNTTAGRASWRKKTNAVGVKEIVTDIELSVKVIDSEEKLRNTLSHELCHVASWIIDQEFKPSHGPAFKYWGKKIMAARKDISVTTRHDYEIAYKHQWRCQNPRCLKVYGRHSKSIDPARHACGACSGRLIPLDKDGNPLGSNSDGVPASPRKESEWTKFSKEEFKKVKSENPTMSMTDISKIVAERWKREKTARAAISTVSPPSTSGLDEVFSTLRV